ncbi:MAG TPA: aminopeptidase P family protein [Clostridia bacterium]|nr:aminopeptidase P family protein [Clostridia bacterium]
MSARVCKIREKIKFCNLDALLITNPINCRYLSGFTGSSGVLLITNEEAILMTDFRYLEQAAVQATDFKVEQASSDFSEGLARLVKKFELKKIGFEAEHISYATYCTYLNALGKASLIPTEGLVEEIRMIKDEQEIQLIKKAASIADQAFDYIINLVKPGVTEKFLAWELEKFMREEGAEKLSFDTIVASGERGALPHGLASDRKIEKGDFITFDFGAVYQGYHSDLTRTIAVGPISAEQERVYKLVLSAQMEAINKLAPGYTGKEIDEIARNIIKEKGYGEYFGHGLGHGVGLAVHEEPRLAVNSNLFLKPGMVVTVEPGIYIPSRFGLRIEDMVLLTEEGCTVLTTACKKLIIL